MKKPILTLIIVLSIFAGSQHARGQCSICTKTASQLGHKPAKALNSGIIYLMVAPLAIIGFVGFRWWQRNGQES